MKKFLSILGIALAFAACSPDKVSHPSEADIPYAEGIEPVITVDNETNEVTFSLPSGTTALIPVWEFQDKNGDFTVYAAQNGLKKIYATAGTYLVRMQVMNNAGLSPDYVERSFTIQNTLVNFDKYLTFFAGGTSGSSKEWRLKGEVDGHFGCGESGTTGTNWWAAKAYEKESTGIYEDRVTFTSDYGYTYDPGEDGMTYVNYGVTASPYTSGQSEDYNFAVDAQTTTYSFGVDGDDLYLVLPANTLFMYIPNDSFVSDPRFKIESVNTKTMELVFDNGSIAWHFTLTCEDEEKEEVFEGFNYTADSNIWRPADLAGAHTLTYWYAPGWSQIADPETTEDNDIGMYTLQLPEATTDQWQAQFFIIPVTDIALSSSVNYDFSCIINSSTAHSGITIKLTDSSDDGNFLFTERISVPALEDYVFYLTDLPGIDASAVKMVFDFGGNEANTEMTVKKITLKDHSVDDGTVVPSTGDDDDDDDVSFVDYSSSDNLWYAAGGDDESHTIFQYYAPDWSQLADPDITLSGSTYSYSLPTATSSQWQAQLHITPVSNLALSSENAYDFKVTVTTTADVKGVTFKLTDTSDDGNFLFTEQMDITAYEETEIEFTNLTGIDAEAVKMVFDFGGNPDNTDVTISDIILQVHTGGSASTSVSYDSDENLWKPADEDNTLTYWYAPGWSQIADPETSYSDGVYTLSLPSATTDQWQAQFFIIPTNNISLSSSETYYFSVTINSSTTFTGVTIKLTDTTDDGNFLLTERVTIDEAYEDIEFSYSGLAGIDADAVKMVFDFGGNPDNTEISVGPIILAKE